MARVDAALFWILGLCGGTLVGAVVVDEGICAFLPCDAAPIAGLTVEPDGAIGVDIVLCPKERLKEIEIIDDDGTVIWRVSTRGSHETHYVVGEQPEGFTTEVPLSSGPPGESAWIYAGSGAARYEPDRARADVVYFEDRYYSLAEFTDRAYDERDCPDDLPLPRAVQVSLLAGAAASGAVLATRPMWRRFLRSSADA